MNLGVVTKSLEQHGGAEIYLLECLRRWQEKADITLYATNINPDLLKEHGVDAKRIQQVELTSFDDDDRRFDLVEDLLILPRLWEQELGTHDVYFLNGFPLHFTRCHPSVYMCHEPPRMLYDLRYQDADANNMVSFHIYPEQEYRKTSVREMEIQLELIETLDRGSRFDRLVVNSRATSRYVKNVYGREADVVAYPGVNPPSEVSDPSPGQRAVYVGRLWRHKRVDLLVKAMALLDEGYLDIVGQGPERDELERLAERLGVADRVVFHGGLSARDLAACYREATCGAYLPVREPFGMMPLEVAAVGRPVIVTPEGGYGEILDSDAALFVPPNPAPIARAMRRLFNNPDLAKKMGQRAREQVSGITWDKTAEDIFQLLEQSARRSVRSSGQPATPKVGAHYYPWYDAGRPMRHWSENTEFASVVDLPIKGAYTSAEDKTIDRHLDMAEHAGIDFFTINWQVNQAGVHPRDLEATERLFAAAEKRSAPALTLMMTIHTSMLDPIKQTLELAKNFSRRPVWLRMRDRPVLWFFISTDFFGSYYAHKSDIELLCEGFDVVATGAVTAPRHLPTDVREFFSGWCLFVPFRVGPPETWDKLWQAAYRHQTMDVGRPYRIFTVAPGYDDRHLSSGRRERTHPRFVDREEGAVYRQMLDCASRLDPGPEIIMITSFNEFHENTQIEPTLGHGDTYLEQTREFTLERDNREKAEDAS